MHERPPRSHVVRLLTFSVLEDASIASISPDYFFKRFEDPVAWSKLAHEMDLYFFDRIEFFPAIERSQHRIDLHHFVPRRGRKSGKYVHSPDRRAGSEHESEPTAAAEPVPAPHSQDEPVSASHGAHAKDNERLARPRRYFEIETELIERRFPADADIRGHFKTLRSYFCHNLIRYLTYKRLILIFAIAVFWVLALNYDGLFRTFIGTFFPAFFDTVQRLCRSRCDWRL